MSSRPSDRSPVTPSTLAGWPLTIVRALDAHGVDGRRLAADAGIDPEHLADPEARVPSAAVVRLFELAAEATANPAFGLTVAKFAQQTTFSALGYSMVASATLKEALERLVRYGRLIGELLDMRLEESRDQYRVVMGFSRTRFPYAAVEAGAATVVRATRLLRGTRHFNPSAVYLERQAPDDVEPYRRFFRAPIAFGQPFTAIEFERAEIDAPLASRHPKLAQQNDAVIVRHLAGLAGATVSSRVQLVLLDRLCGGTPTKHLVARRLGMSSRNLQRHLAAEATSFKQLLRESRLKQTDDMLREGRLSIKEVAERLGFAGPSAFTRAFKRWTGSAPTQHPARRRNR